MEDANIKVTKPMMIGLFVHAELDYRNFQSLLLPHVYLGQAIQVLFLCESVFGRKTGLFYFYQQGSGQKFWMRKKFTFQS